MSGSVGMPTFSLRFLKLDLSDISYEAVAWFLLKQSVWAVLMYLNIIATKYNGPLEAAHARSEDDSQISYEAEA